MLLTEAHESIFPVYNPGEGGILNKVQGGSALGSKPNYPLINHFGQKRYSFHVSSISNSTPFI